MTPRIKYIDLNHLEKYVAGDDGLRDEILCIFKDQAEKLCAELDPENDDEAWKDTVHALKGASRGIGAWKLGDACEEAEDLIGNVSSKNEKRDGIVVVIRNYVGFVITDVEHIRKRSFAA